MIIDARREAPRAPVECDVCIVGAGAAGITLARSLDRPSRSICVLEGGGLAVKRSTQSLLAGECALDYPPLEGTRAAALGGSTSVWSGWCRPLDGIDFERRAELPHSGWPIALEELQPFYAQAHEVLQLGRYSYGCEEWERASGATRLPLSDHEISSILFRQSAVKFGATYRSELATTRSVCIYTHANVMALKFSPEARCVSAIEVATTAPGSTFEVRPRIAVLAGGGIENARLLLLSSRGGERGPGNPRGVVGRYFTEHGYVDSASYVPARPEDSLKFYTEQAAGQEGHIRTGRGALSVPHSRQRREGLLNCAMFFRPAYESHPAFKDPRVQSVLSAWDMLKGCALADRPWTRLACGAAAPLALSQALWSKLRRGGQTRAREWRMRTLFECAPDPNNRIELSGTCDALGRPVARVHWRMREADVRSVVRSHRILDAALRSAGLGHLQLRGEEPAEWLAAAEPGRHHMGATRMHADPAQGVVDRNCRVHGIDNLFVAGSSVFPSGGFANPTLTVVALTLRLASALSS
jgi:choline dehydrogenase-like flavoprotein